MSQLQKAFDERFGNYILHGMQEIYLPNEIAWWPQTSAWKILALVLLGVLLLLLRRALQNWQANRYRRHALKQLQHIADLYQADQAQLSKVAVLLKSTALQILPRDRVAQLSGDAWIDALSESQNSQFCETAAEALQRVAYQAPHTWGFESAQVAALFKAARHWLKTHAAASEND